jgi:hypothetical protein
MACHRIENKAVYVLTEEYSEASFKDVMQRNIKMNLLPALVETVCQNKDQKVLRKSDI